MNRLKCIQYIKPKIIYLTNKDHCLLCYKEDLCYSSNHYYHTMSQPLKICQQAYKELTEFPAQMILIDYLLSHMVVNDVKKIIQLLIYETNIPSKCTDL